MTTIQSLHLHPTIIYRTPQFSYNGSWHTCWPPLKQSIAVSASAELNELLAVVQDETDLRRLPQNLRQTIWKYFNRATFRSTPYGAFAAVGVATIADAAQAQGLRIKDQYLHTYPDWLAHRQLEIKQEQVFDKNCLLLANSSWYVAGKDIRYISKEETGYELVDISSSGLIRTLLYSCEAPKAAASVCHEFAATYGEKEVKDAIWQMLADQLLFCSLQPNLSGQEYFERFGFTMREDTKPYIIAERPLASGDIPRSLLRHVPEVVALLAEVLPSYHATALNAFATAFAARFGEKEIPLMVALDPELGVGYGQMDQQVESPLIETLRQSAGNKEQEPSTQEFLIKAIAGTKQRIIQLEELSLPVRKNNLPLANSVPVICTVSDDLVYMEYAGGATANAILGRFSLPLTEIEQHCRQLAASEQAANPDVLFFDVSYAIGSVTDNVNRRKHIYPLQLSIHNFDTSEKPLHTGDLMVSVHGDQVFLRSKKWGKRMVPRFASGYNYMFSDLPLFRFLCDLQHQQVHKNLSLKLRDRISGLSYYPRLQHKNVVLSPETWLITINAINSLPGETVYERLKAYLAERHMSRYLKCGCGDQTLFFDTKDTEHLTALYDHLRKEKEAYFEESWLPVNSLIKDEQGNPFMPQLILTLTHQENIYTGLPEPFFGTSNNLIIPGDDWLYFEIFVHPSRTDDLVCSHILPFIAAHKTAVKSWFFVRYNQDGPHMRLRIQLQDQERMQQVTQQLFQVLKPWMETGIISDIRLRPYRRETERYGELFIEHVEQHFFIDTCFVTAVLTEDMCTDQKYLWALKLLTDCRELLLLPTGDFDRLIAANSAAYCSEHSLGPMDFKALNKAAKELNNNMGLTGSPALTVHYLNMLNSLTATVSIYEPRQRPVQFSALFHMLVNRLFACDQRLQETIIYYFFERSLKTFRAKAILNPCVQ
ncbi:lantibiotic dehydratase [Mucilaginibacter sp. RS28]|uniref:Lantibiotic dehydratase n=1 Tax=Mucilaginibacter straminoryzae TaxID=2932774 RepID=A0A9X1X0H4_9SPHI|nr:lantibiotic dehydratase [Mucilaginibacter straminoryzae]MCJ8208100.1 lantibiotic dehydratase [Mucilaginibacter straminoryzae]